MDGCNLCQRINKRMKTLVKKLMAKEVLEKP